MAARPNFFIIGSMKSGTSTLYEYFVEHPDIFMPAVKEPSYFVDRTTLKQIWPEMERQGFWRGEELYLALFEGAREGQAVGEASTNYSKFPRIKGVPERIHAFNPDARIIYVMRDPVERTISHYWHNVRTGAERRDLEKAITDHPYYRDVSYYRMQIEPYIDLFGWDRVKIITFETLRDSPMSVLPELFEWLGADASFRPPNLGGRYNERPPEIEQIRGFGLLERFRYSKVWDIMGPMVPARLRSLGRVLARKPVDPANAEKRNAVRFLQPIQREQTRELAALCGHEFPEWRTLYGEP